MHRFSPALTRSAKMLGVLAALAIVGLYLYNSARHNEPSLQGDQWFWMTNVVVPYEDGRLSLFEAITFEYQSFAHSHIPTLVVFLINYSWFGLTSSFDTVIGVLSLCGIWAIGFRHLRGSTSGVWLWAGVIALTSIVFVSSDPSNFVWSLLQFQMFYILVGVFYLKRFATQAENPTIWFALIATPAAMLLGDSMGSAAVASSLLYLFILVLARRVRWRQALPYFVLFPVQLLVLAKLFNGQRQHGGASSTEFVDQLIDQPAETIEAFYNAISQSLVALHAESTNIGFLRWDFAWLWFGIAAVVLGGVVVGLRRCGWSTTDHFPLMLIVASLIWSLGVIRARVGFLGPEAMQAPRYASYTMVLGIGALLLVVAKAPALGRGRVAVMAAMVLVVGANLAGSLQIALDDSGEIAQDRELTRIEGYVTGELPDPPILGLACSDFAPCLESASELWDLKRGPFAGDETERLEWVAGFRDIVYDRWHDFTIAERAEFCPTGVAYDDAAASADLDGDLVPWLEERQVVVPPENRDEAVLLLQRAMATECVGFEIQVDRGLISLEE